MASSKLSAKSLRGRGLISPRMAASQRNGRLGGLARMKSTTAEQRQAIGEKAGAAVVTRYGVAFFRFMAQCKRKKLKPVGA